MFHYFEHRSISCTAAESELWAIPEESATDPLTLAACLCYSVTSTCTNSNYSCSCVDD
jgi:hypothetical protein